MPAILERNLWWIRLFNAGAGIVTFLFILGIVQAKSVYFVLADTTMKCALAAWLIYRFGRASLAKDPLTAFDRHACFVAGMYILLSSLSQVAIHYRVSAKEWAEKLFLLNN
jgi:hypothetical protein